jgi:hypothetical protein
VRASGCVDAGLEFNVFLFVLRTHQTECETRLRGRGLFCPRVGRMTFSSIGMRPILGGVLRNRPEIRGVLKIALKSYDFEKSTWNPGGT